MHGTRVRIVMHIGNEIFAWFETSHGKSRLNFLGMLRAGDEDYALNPTAFGYMKTQKLPAAQMELLTGCGRSVFDNYTEWKVALESLGFTKDRHIRIATEGALLGSIQKNESINPDMVIVSDDAEQSINRPVGYNDSQCESLAKTRTQIWEFCAELKAYKQTPTPC